MLEALASEFRVRAAVLRPPESGGSGEYPAAVDVEEIPQARRSLRQAEALASSAFTGAAYSDWMYRSRALSSRLARWVAREKPAWVVAHSYHVAPAALETGSPAWVDFHNVDSEIWRRLGETSTGLERIFLRFQAPRVARLERDILRRTRGVSCVSERDAVTLSTAGGAVPVVIPNGVDLNRYVFRPEPSSEDMVFFVGDLTWPPNFEGIRWFCSEVWPVLSRLSPSARVEILGRGAGGRLSKLLRNPPARVTFLGEGDDTRPHWGRAAVAIVPLLTGGGTRLKVLEAAACGVPVVATPLGAEGLDFTEGSEIRLAARAQEFAAAVAGLLADRGARRAQAAAARRRVESEYDWREIGRRFAGELSRRVRPE